VLKKLENTSYAMQNKTSVYSMLKLVSYCIELIRDSSIKLIWKSCVQQKRLFLIIWKTKCLLI